jgi:hypothetical protein
MQRVACPSPQSSGAISAAGLSICLLVGMSKFFIKCYNWPAFAFLIYIKCTLAVDETNIEENNFSCFFINKHVNHDVLWGQQQK